MTQTTLIPDTRFLRDLYAAGGHGELDRLVDQYDQVLIPEEVLTVLENFEEHTEIRAWLEDAEDKVQVLPPVDTNLLLEAFPGNYNSNQILSDGLASTTYPILYAVEEHVPSGQGLTIITNSPDMRGLSRGETSADIIFGVHNYLDRQLASGEVEIEQYSDLHASATYNVRNMPPNTFLTDGVPAEDLQLYRDAGVGPEDIPTILHPDTRAMTLDEDGANHVFANPTLQTLTRITPEGTETTVYDTAREAMHAFGDARLEAYTVNPDFFGGSLPATVAGDLRALTDAYTNKIDPSFGQRVGQRFGDVGEFIGQGTKILGPVGVLQGLYEAGNLSYLSDNLVEEGLLSQEAADAYSDILEDHIVQGTFDPTMFGFELAVQSSFDSVMEEHNVHPAIHEILEPGSVLEDIGSAIGYVAGIEPDQPWRDGTSLTAAISELHEAQLQIEFDHRELQDYPSEYDRMTSRQTYETFETLIAEGDDRLPVELTDEMSRGERIDAILDSAETVFAERGYTREIPFEQDTVDADISVVLPTREDVSDTYEAGPY